MVAIRQWLFPLTLSAVMAGCTPPVVIPPVEPPAAEPQLIFEVPLLGEITKVHFATITLYRGSFTQTRVILLAKEFLEHAGLSLALPDCLAPVRANARTTWDEAGLQAGEHVWTQTWWQTRSKCVGNGTLLYAVASRYYGDRGSIPFDWPIDEP